MKNSFSYAVTLMFAVLICSCGGKSGSNQVGPTPTPTPTPSPTPSYPECITGAAAFSGGLGTQSSPFLISTPIQLYYMSCNNNYYYQLTQDIDFSKAGQSPQTSIIGGGFDGQGHMLSNWVQDSQTTTVGGIFSMIHETTVQNLNLVNAKAGYQGASTGGVLANTVRNSTITNVQVSGTVTSETYAGGIASYVYTSTVSDVSASATVVSLGNGAGGLFGDTLSLTLIHSSSSGQVSAGGSFAGGLVGVAFSSSITTSYSTADTLGQGSDVGGLVGQSNSTSITNSYSTGATSASSAVGGLVGDAETTTIAFCYAAGDVAGSANGGGLVAYTQNGGNTYSASYWDTQATTQSTSLGGTGETTTAMQTQATFSGWDFTNTWQITAGQYPTLK